MRNFIRSLIFAFPLVFSSVGATSEVKDNPVEIVETSLEDRVQNVDVPMLNNLVGKPEEGNVLSKLTDLFFEGESSINLRISRETLENYFYQSKNERILRTAEGLLENFYSIDINSSIGGGIRANFSDDVKFLVDMKDFTLKCEVSSNYRSTIIDKFVSDSRTSYVFKINEGYAKLEVKKWYIGILDFFGVDRASIPEFEKADYVISMNGTHHALFRFENGELRQMEDIFDNFNNKYKIESLNITYLDAFESGVKSIKKDRFK